jgi:hypothetical protein
MFKVVCGLIYSALVDAGHPGASSRMFLALTWITLYILNFNLI